LKKEEKNGYDTTLSSTFNSPLLLFAALGRRHKNIALKKITHICVFLTDHQIFKKKKSNHLIFRKQNIS